ncbi:MAG: hypothetical protein COW55_03380 [Rhodobacteraceae bacterium CG17_big_fil_post_rev_8_21_14_2_50_65_11]|nr:MAG: hypothetical protein COW55_03380 [Rhodobacteraceae bacterium CG17_big_fil_post_rev_8_21_14_2_50_65_11]
MEYMTVGSAAVRVNAVLTAFRDDENSDVIDSLCYFYVPILDKLSGKPITASLLAKAAKLIYGWNLTESVGHVFVERLAAQGHLLKEERNGQDYFIAQPSPDLAIDVETSIQESFDQVTDLFREFELVSGDPIYRQLTREQLGDLLVRFLISLDAYSNNEISASLKAGDIANGERSALQELKDDVSVLSQSETHVCARFVQRLSREQPELAEKLSLFVAAGLLAELVEDFRKPSALETKSETTFLLDGPMLLGLIGTSGEALQVEARTIVEALKSIGCRVQVFSESCREAERVLASYLKASPSDRHGRTHTAILKGEVDRAYVQTVASDIEAAAEKFGVHVRDYSLEAFPNDHKYFDDERNKDVYSFLSWDNPLARDHDAFAVTAIMRMRHGKHKNDPLQNSHVFISSNEKLVRKAREYCLQSQLVRETQCGPVVDTRDLATIAWLRTGFENSEKLPTSHMLAQCERVLRVRKDVIENARQQVAKFTPENVEQFELLLQDNRAVSYLMDTARGSSAPFDPDRDQELLDGMLDAAIKVVRDETEAKLSEKDKKIRQLRAESRKAQEETQAEYEARLNEEAQKTADMEARLAELERQRAEDAKRLALVSSRHETIMREGIEYSNKRISRYQVLGAALLAAAGSLATFGVFWDPSSLPPAVDWGSKLIATIGVIFTVLALLGRPVPGLWQVIERRGEKWYSDYCVNKGVPAVEAQERLLVGTSRLLLAEVDREIHETDCKAVRGQDS